VQEYFQDWTVMPMLVKMIILPSEDGLNVLLWERWIQGSMRTRYFADRTTMIATLESLRLITSQQSKVLEDFVFGDSCPLYSAEIDEPTLEAHGFHLA
jgi:hypothetical protein